jgi:hypothetical protein
VDESWRNVGFGLNLSYDLHCFRARWRSCCADRGSTQRIIAAIIDAYTLTSLWVGDAP